MTVHKAMYGIDPILSEKIYLQDIAEKTERHSSSLMNRTKLQ